MHFVRVFLRSVVLVLSFGTIYSDRPLRSRKILMLGGNGFIGSTTAHKILNLDENTELILINRRSYYWDFEERVLPYVRNIDCERPSLRNCAALLMLLESDPQMKFDAVIDFSGFHPDDLSAALDVVQNRTNVYIYISSDSVYEVSRQKDDETRMTKEIDAVRPHDKEDQSKLNELDMYGHLKLMGEELLLEQHEKSGLPYVIFRLPDVIGSRDNTYRFWTYMMWMRLREHVPGGFHVPERYANTELSFVYVDDVANAIVTALDKDAAILNHAFNLACRETPTLLEFLDEIRISMKLPKFDSGIRDNNDAKYYFPSVTRGAIEIAKAEVLMKWNPTPLKEVIQNTVDFYNFAYEDPQFHRQAVYIVESLQKDLIGEAGDIKESLQSINYALKEMLKDEL